MKFKYLFKKRSALLCFILTPLWATIEFHSPVSGPFMKGACFIYTGQDYTNHRSTPNFFVIDNLTEKTGIKALSQHQLLGYMYGKLFEFDGLNIVNLKNHPEKEKVNTYREKNQFKEIYNCLEKYINKDWKVTSRYLHHEWCRKEYSWYHDVFDENSKHETDPNNGFKKFYKIIDNKKEYFAVFKPNLSGQPLNDQKELMNQGQVYKDVKPPKDRHPELQAIVNDLARLYKFDDVAILGFPAKINHNNVEIKGMLEKFVPMFGRKSKETLNYSDEVEKFIQKAKEKQEDKSKRASFIRLIENEAWFRDQLELHQLYEMPIRFTNINDSSEWFRNVKLKAELMKQLYSKFDQVSLQEILFLSFLINHQDGHSGNTLMSYDEGLFKFFLLDYEHAIDESKIRTSIWAFVPTFPAFFYLVSPQQVIHNELRKKAIKWNLSLIEYYLNLHQCSPDVKKDLMNRCKLIKEKLQDSNLNFVNVFKKVFKNAYSHANISKFDSRPHPIWDQNFEGALSKMCISKMNGKYSIENPWMTFSY